MGCRRFTTVSVVMKWTQKPFLTRLICWLAADWSGPKVCERLETCRDSWRDYWFLYKGGAEQLERPSAEKRYCVCVCGWGLYKLPPHPAGSSASFPSFRNNQQTTLLSTKTCLMSPYLLCSCRSHTNGEREGKRERKKRERERALRLLLHIWLTDKQSLGYALVSRRGGGQLCVDGTALVTPKPWRLSPDIKQKKRSEGCTQAHARAHAVEASRIVSLWLSRTTTIGLFRNRGLVHSRWGQPSPQRWKTSCSW